MDIQTLTYYAANAADVASRYESIVNGLAADFDRAFAPCARVLDVGCGSGRDMAYLQARGREAYGIDATPELVELAQQLHPELHGRIVCGALPAAPVPHGGNFDGVLCSAVLMHIPVADQPAAVRFIKQCLRPGGTLLYSVPSQRADVTGSQRDAAGRLFIPDSAGQLQALFEAEGLVLLDQWGNTDSLGRDGVQWLSVLMQRGAA